MFNQIREITTGSLQTLYILLAIILNSRFKVSTTGSSSVVSCSIELSEGNIVSNRLGGSGRSMEEAILACAKDYVEHSNLHNVDNCISFLTEDAEYVSSTVGSYKGIAEISRMMESFFQKFPAVNWQVQEYTVHSPDCVEFEFVRTGCLDAEGHHVVAKGRELLYFREVEGQLRICKIQVEASTTETIR